MLELDLAVNQSKQGVILADSDIVAGMYCCTSLADDNVACLYSLTVRLLNAETLCFAVTTVLGGAAALLMSEKLNTNLQHSDSTILSKESGLRVRTVCIADDEIIGEFLLQLAEVDH